MQIFDDSLLKKLSSQARSNPRLRKNFNLHSSYDEPSQRLLNAMEPDSYIRPHRHQIDPKSECFVAIRGKFALVTFNNEGDIEQLVRFGPGGDAVGAELPPGVWHTVVCLEHGSIFFETKSGPYNPILKKDMAPWAPEEKSDGALEYLQKLRSMIDAYRS